MNSAPARTTTCSPRLPFAARLPRAIVGLDGVGVGVSTGSDIGRSGEREVTEICKRATRAKAVDPGRKAHGIDDKAREKNLTRLRRIEGQVRGLRKMVKEDRYCPEILIQIASVHEALRSVSRELARNHLKQCATIAIRTGGVTAQFRRDRSTLVVVANALRSWRLAG